MVEVFVERAAGLDVHKRTVVATVHTPEVQETRTDGTMTEELRELGRWLEALGVTHVAMESTGPYWKSVYNIGGIRLRAPRLQRAARQGGPGPQDGRARRRLAL
ncbi:MAG TPA: transposase [Thermaerobacter sp.]